MTVWQGPYPYKNGAVDKNVKDAESAFYHEWSVHILPAERAAVKELAKFEAQTFNTKEACESAMSGAIARAVRDFYRELRRNPL